MFYVVRFTDVGANKKSWTTAYAGPPDEYQLATDVKKSGSLMSRGIDISINEDGLSGAVIVGMFRIVGRFTITKPGQLPSPK